MAEEALRQEFEDCKKLALSELEALQVFKENHKEELKALGEAFGGVSSILLTGASLKNPTFLLLGQEVAELMVLIFYYGYMRGSETKPVKIEV